MNMRVKEWSHWAAGYGLPRATLKLFAYRGDPLSRLLIDTRQADNIYPRIEQVRRQYGRVSLVNKVVWVTADAQIVREVLRDHRYPGPSNRATGHLFVSSSGSWPRPTRIC